jgi:hypothetical protein
MTSERALGVSFRPQAVLEKDFYAPVANITASTVLTRSRRRSSWRRKTTRVGRAWKSPPLFTLRTV